MRVKQVTEVSPEFAALHDGPSSLVPYPPVYWFVRGPRGGVYMAIGVRTREAAPRDLATREFFWRNPADQRIWVIDTSESARYVRPGTKLHAQALAALD